jgi:hypothetical protein
MKFCRFTKKIIDRQRPPASRLGNAGNARPDLAGVAAGIALA